MFVSQLQVRHVDGKNWRLTAPLIYRGNSEYFIVHEGFETDFASIPRPLRWLLDNAGRNSEAAVLHDILWRSSKADDPRIDAWNVDALFRRALRQTGSTALARGMMWAAVRVVAIGEGRFGNPAHIGAATRATSLLTMIVLGLATIIVPTFAVLGGTFLYWIVSWIIAAFWYLAYEKKHFPDEVNWPWPFNKRKPSESGKATSFLEIVKRNDTSPDPLGGLPSDSPEELSTAELKTILGKVAACDPNIPQT